MDISNLLLDFRITSHCNLGCDLCFRNPGIKDSSLSSTLDVIERMYGMRLDKGVNLVIERSHIEDCIFINFMLKAEG